MKNNKQVVFHILATMQNKTTRSPEISRQQVQKLTPPPLSTPALIFISLFSLIYNDNEFSFHTTKYNIYLNWYTTI